MARIELRELTKTYEGNNRRTRVCALDRLSLVVEDREWMVVAGPSGCGKTTLLRLIAGLEQPSEGEILIDNRSQTTVPPENRNIAMVFQDPALYPHLTIFENIGLGLKLRGCAAPEIRERVSRAAEMLEISDCLERKPMELSGGQRHRVSLGRAMVRRPSVFLFDEPLASLDLPSREQMRRKLVEVCRATTASVIYVTHDQSEAMMIGDRVAVIEQGRLQQVGKPPVVYAHPENLFVAQFIGSPTINICLGRIATNGDARLFLGDGWRLRLDQPGSWQGHPETVALGIRPEEILPVAHDDPGDALEALVEEVHDLGARKQVRLTIAGQTLVACWAATCAPVPKQVTRVRMAPRAVRLFDPRNGKTIR